MNQHAKFSHNNVCFSKYNCLRQLHKKKQVLTCIVLLNNLDFIYLEKTCCYSDTNASVASERYFYNITTFIDSCRIQLER